MSVVSKPKGIHSLSFNVITCAFSFLEAPEVMNAEKVCQSWKNLINHPNQAIWKLQCQNLVALNSPNTFEVFAQCIAEGGDRVDAVKKQRENFLRQGACKLNPRAVSYGLEMIPNPYSSDNAPGKLNDPKICRVIGEYVPDCMDECIYKIKALVVTGKTSFNHWYINDKPKHSEFRPQNASHRWGTDEVEPFAGIKIYPNPFDLPCEVPLQIFFARDGAYKQEGDEVRLIWKNRKVILVLAHELEDCNGIPIPTLHEALNKRIAISSECNFMNVLSILRAKALAMTAPEWLKPD